MSLLFAFFLGQYGSLDILLEREILTLHLDGANE